MEIAEPTLWPDFTDWWDLYDHKCDRKKCEKKWGKLSQADKEKAMAHTERYVAATFTDGRFPSRRHPSTYLNNENWHDEALIRTTAVAKQGQQSPNEYAHSAADALARRLADSEG